MDAPRCQPTTDRRLPPAACRAPAAGIASMAFIKPVTFIVSIAFIASVTFLPAPTVGSARGQERFAEVDRAARADFRTLLVTRSLDHERLMPYLEAARPEIVQIGNYGAMFHGYADNPKSKGTPMMLPIVGERAALDFQKKLNHRIHALGLTVVGHFRLVKVMGDWEARTGFVDYYDNRWPADLLGPKPHADLRELLQRDADGNPVQVSRYDNAQLTLCLSSPHARKMLKQMLKCAVDHGVDGVMTTYNYRFECACPYCQDAFKAWLKEHLTPDQVRERLGVDNLPDHVFPSIPARIPGYPDPAQADELDWLAARWGAEHFKRMFDEIFLDYGRSLREDLIVGQWNHLGHVGQNEERMFLPLEQWGRGEDYFWYSGGASFVGKNLNQSEGMAGDAWLSCLYVRALSGHKPFVMGKYDRIRMAVSMAEGYATGGLGMGRYMRFEDPVGFKVLARYTNFMHEHRDLYDNARPWADAALVLPRQDVLARHPESLDAFRELGQELVERRVLLDVVVDQNLTSERLARYPAVILATSRNLSDAQVAALRQYRDNGGTLLLAQRTGVSADTSLVPQDEADRRAVVVQGESPSALAERLVARLLAAGSGAIESPRTVRAAAYVQPGRLVLHLVNYDREEKPVAGQSGPPLERPILVSNVKVRLRLPVGRHPTAVRLHTPDDGDARQLPFRVRDGQIEFTVPSVTVYAVIAVGD